MNWPNDRLIGVPSQESTNARRSESTRRFIDLALVDAFMPPD
jgi:hypothetical protein